VPAPAENGPESRTARNARNRRRWLIALAVPVTITIVLGIAAGVALWSVQSGINSKIERFGDPFQQIPAASRPTEAAATDKAINLLIFGSDSRISAGDPRQWAAGSQRTDAIMVVHIPADRGGAYVVSIPRDSWVDVPGHGKAKINAAYSWGGPALAIRTVEELTKIRIDHMLITDFTGFARITDLLGGVSITVPKTTTGNTHGQGKNFAAGTYTMDGQTALGYVRQRYVLPDGDLDRVKRQQNWIRSILRKAVSSGLARDPQKLLAVVDTAAASIATDDEFSVDTMRNLALSLRNTNPGKAAFMTAPITGTGWSPDHTQAIVLLDTSTADTLWTAIRNDEVGAWITRTKYSQLPEAVR
jgi:LCP family protein required for cell wall assembly